MNQKQTLQKEKERIWLRQVAEEHGTGNLITRLHQQAKVLTTLSYLPQFLSLATAIYAVYYFASLYDGFKYFFLLMIGGIILGAMELGKREMSSKAWRGHFNSEHSVDTFLFLPLAAIVALSFAISYTGGDKFVQEESAAPVASYDAQRDSINQEISEAREQISVMKQQTWKGTIVRDARATISQLEKRINALTDQRLKLENRDLEATDKAEAAHEARVTSLGLYFGVLAGVMDAVLILFFFIIQRAKWNAYLLTKNGNSNAVLRPVTRPTVTGNGNRNETAERKIIRAFKPFENGDGNDVTSVTLRSCNACGADISHKNETAKYCSDSCRVNHWRTKNKT